MLRFDLVKNCDDHQPAQCFDLSARQYTTARIPVCGQRPVAHVALCPRLALARLEHRKKLARRQRVFAYRQTVFACHSAFKTSSAWPIPVTLGQPRMSFPLGSKRNVERCMAFLP